APPHTPGNAYCSRSHDRFRVAPSTLKYHPFGEGGRDASNPHAGCGRPARLDCSWTDSWSPGDVDGVRAVADSDANTARAAAAGATAAAGAARAADAGRARRARLC